MTREQAVLDILISAQKGERFYYHGRIIPYGFVPLKDIANEKCGGSAGTRRVRHLRGDELLDIELESFSVELHKDGKPHKERTFIYCLNTPAYKIDRLKCCLRPVVSEYKPDGNGQLSFA